MSYWIATNNGVRLGFGALTGLPVYTYHEDGLACAKFADRETALGFAKYAERNLDPGPGVARDVKVEEVGG